MEISKVIKDKKFIYDSISEEKILNNISPQTPSEPLRSLDEIMFYQTWNP